MKVMMIKFIEDFSLIGAIANCSSYQNLRRENWGSLLGLNKTSLTAEFAVIKILCWMHCFI
jgi:hypothetical protein